MEAPTPHGIGVVGPWVLGAVALVQVWVIAAFKRLKRSDLDIFESGSIELGYSNYGPTVALTGTLWCKHKKVLIDSMELLITRLKDRAERHLSWLAFRPNTVALGSSAPPNVELATSVVIPAEDAFKYNVFFVDQDFISEHKAPIDQLAQAWQQFVAERVAEAAQPSGQRPISVEQVIKDPVASEAAFSGFSKRDDVAKVLSALDRGMSWEPGRYKIVLVVSAVSQTFEAEWTFTLRSEDAERLRLNAVATLRTVCGLAAAFNFAYPSYEYEPAEPEG